MYTIVHERGKFDRIHFYQPGLYRVLNTKTNSLNPAIFNTLEEAKQKVAQLEKWAAQNASPEGKARTARGNAKYLAKYHANKNLPSETVF